MSAWASVRQQVAAMTDSELAQAAQRIRGTAKRGRRRMLSEGESVALAAIYEEQGYRASCQPAPPDPESAE